MFFKSSQFFKNQITEDTDMQETKESFAEPDVKRKVTEPIRLTDFNSNIYKFTNNY